jgi:hypothetical protein
VSTKLRKHAGLSKDEKAIVEMYVSLLDAVPGPVSVWVTNDEGMLHFFTLVAPDGPAENEVYEAERNLLRIIDPLLVDFDVHRWAEYVHQFLFKDKPPLFHRD